MTARTPFPGTITAGDVVTAASNNRLPGGWLIHLEDATDTSGYGVADPIPGMTCTFTAVSTRVYKHTVSSICSHTVGDALMQILISDGSGTGLARGSASHSQTSTASRVSINFTFFESGISGSVTRKLTTNVSSGTMAVIGTSSPLQYTIEDIGSTT